MKVSNEIIDNLIGHELADIELIEGKRLQKGILLQPQPSNDPNDLLVSSSSNPSYEYSIY